MREIKNDKLTPAFPVILEQPPTQSVPVVKGLTMRDYFASFAMQGILAFGAVRFDYSPHKIADEAYKYADAMLEQSNK